MTLTVVDTLTLGAVKSPVLLMVPAVAPQITVVLVVPLTVEVNCCVAPAAMDALVGESAIVIGGAAGGGGAGAFTVTVMPATVLL